MNLQQPAAKARVEVMQKIATRDSLGALRDLYVVLVDRMQKDLGPSQHVLEAWSRDAKSGAASDNDGPRQRRRISNAIKRTDSALPTYKAGFCRHSVDNDDQGSQTGMQEKDVLYGFAGRLHDAAGIERNLLAIDQQLGSLVRGKQIQYLISQDCHWRLHRIHIVRPSPLIGESDRKATKTVYESFKLLYHFGYAMKRGYMNETPTQFICNFCKYR